MRPRITLAGLAVSNPTYTLPRQGSVRPIGPHRWGNCCPASATPPGEVHSVHRGEGYPLTSQANPSCGDVLAALADGPGQKLAFSAALAVRSGCFGSEEPT